MAFKLREAAIVTQMSQDNFEAIIGEIEAINILVGRRFKRPKPVGHPGVDMGEAVIASGQNGAEPDGAEPAQTEALPVAMGGKIR